MCKPLSHVNEDEKAQDLERANKSSDLHGWRSVFLFPRLLACSLLFACTILFIRQFFAIDIGDPNKCVYVPGGGHGAILFHYGQLDRIGFGDNTTELYCSSAGCIASVFALSGLPNSIIIDIYEKAYARSDEKSTFPTPGIIVESAINELISRMDEQQMERVGRKLNILTTTIGVGLHARKPRNLIHLKALLRQTSWIPYLTADGLYDEDEEGIHIDGDFISKISPPQCKRSLVTPFITHSNLIWHLFIPVRSIEMIGNLIDAGSDFRSSHLIRSCKAPWCLRGLPQIKVLSKLSSNPKQFITSS